MERYDLEDIHSPGQVCQSPPSFFSISIDSFEACIRLNTPQTPSTTSLTAILVSRSVSLTAEVNPCGKSGLVYTTLTCGQIEGHVSGTLRM